jgi:penicillin-binding protein 1A
MSRTRTRNRPLALWRRSPPWAKRSAVAGAALLLLWVAALAVANRPSALQRLRGAIREAVEHRLSGAEIGDSVSIDPLFRVSFGPLTLRAERKGAPPVLHADRVKVRANWGALFAGRIEPASIRLYGVRIEPGERLGELRELADRLQSRPDGKRTASIDLRQVPRDWPAIHLRGAVVALRHAGRTLEIGPLDLSVLRSRRPGAERLELSLSHRDGGHLELELQRGEGELRLWATASDVGPEVLPAPLSSGSVRWTGGALSGELSLSGKAGAQLTGRIHGRVDRARFSGERLAPEPVGPVTIDLDGALEGDLSDRRLALRDGVIHALGSIDATLQAEARHGPGFPFSVSLEVPELEYGALVSALPAPFQPPADAPRPSGHLSFSFGLAGPLRDPASWTVEADLDLANLREAAKREPPVALRSPFSWRPEVARGEPPTIVVGPANPSFVPIADLPEHVIRAVTTSEDAGFFAHPGFDFEELRNAFAQGAEAGHVVRGASTITQQLAKNLYLSREKTLARKAREALVAVALEATVPKARLLEIYLNIAEWGPGLWGIGPAAQHYFGKPARDLTPREAAFLASIIPNPVRFHGYYDRGELDEAWTERLRTILLNMAQAGVLTEEQLAEALDAPLVFARP